MEDIELIIRISKEDFEIMKHNIAVNNPLCPLSQEEMVYKVANGIPLPKGHWILKKDKIGRTFGVCSECNHLQYVGELNYCPYCGTKIVKPQDSEE